MRFFRSFTLAVVLVSVCTGTAARAETFVVFAAASMKTALDEIGAIYADRTEAEPRFSYAASSALARQIERGAPADVFISANVAWMDHLLKADKVQRDTLVTLAGNRLVLVAHGPSQPLDLDDAEAATMRFADARVAMALVEAVPAGIYGKAALTALGLWDHLSAQIVQTDNVRSALMLVARGDAPFGLVYASDALVEPRVSVAAFFPGASHPPILYPAALTQRSTSTAAADFLTFLSSGEAQGIFARHGFTVAGE